MVIVHSMRVGFYLQRAVYSRDVVLAGLLHDVVEDSDTTVGAIEESFGARVADLVAANTVDENLDRLERGLESMHRCKQVGVEALLVKAADLLDNLGYYLDEANPKLLGWMKTRVQTFLELSGEELGDEAVWAELSRVLDEMPQS